MNFKKSIVVVGLCFIVISSQASQYENTDKGLEQKQEQVAKADYSSKVDNQIVEAWREKLYQDTQDAIHPFFKVTKWVTAVVGIVGLVNAVDKYAGACSNTEQKKAMWQGIVSVASGFIGGYIAKKQHDLWNAVYMGNVHTRDCLRSKLLKTEKGNEEISQNDFDQYNAKAAAVLMDERVVEHHSTYEDEIVHSFLIRDDHQRQKLGVRCLGMHGGIPTLTENPDLHQYIRKDVVALAKQYELYKNVRLQPNE